MKGTTVRSRKKIKVKGFAFDAGSGIETVHFSADGGATWRNAELGKDLGRYSFRMWEASFSPPVDGVYSLQVKAVAKSGETQLSDASQNWNPKGYLRNVIETVKVTAVSSI